MNKTQALTAMALQQLIQVENALFLAYMHSPEPITKPLGESIAALAKQREALDNINHLAAMLPEGTAQRPN